MKRRAEALNYSLIIGAHGCGWTYKSDWVNYPYMARPNAGFAQKGSTSYPTATGNFSGIQYGPDPNKPITRFFGSVSLEENALDVPTLAEGIKLSGTKMQYILFDACYMGNVETAYELKDVTNFMISSSSEVMGAGVPYKPYGVTSTVLHPTTQDLSTELSISTRIVAIHSAIWRPSTADRWTI